MLPNKPKRWMSFAHLHYNNMINWGKGKGGQEYFMNQQLPADHWVIYIGTKCKKCGKDMIPIKDGWIHNNELRCEDCKEEGFVPVGLPKGKWLGYLLITQEMYDYYKEYFDPNKTDDEAIEFAKNYKFK